MKRNLLICALGFIIAFHFPHETQAQLRKANRALERGNHTEAMELASELMTEKPDDHKTWDLLARIHDAQAAQASQISMEEYIIHVQEMVAAYNKVAELRSQEADNINNRLQLFYMQSFNQGIEQFNNAQAVADDEGLQAEHFQNSAKYFQASSIASPDSSGAYINWAYALLGAGDSQAAIEPLKLALEYGEPEIELYSFLARIYLTSDRASDAVPLLEKAVEDFPDNSELQSYLLNAYSETGQDDRALEKYAEAVTNNPENEIYRYNYGSLLLQRELFDDAIEQLMVAVEINPQYVDAYYNLGAAYINKANTVQKKITALDDEMRERDDELSAEEEQSMMEDIDDLVEERKALYQLSIAPLESAKEYAEQEEERSVQEICAALFQAYAQTGQDEAKIMSVSECAGM
ncbi:MAG: tetratricopeptide repeat protein [Bacteroidetes bacterium]|nr:tetratricopeptide repeat protein [Bacteroidota bacterium]MCY4206262.1 tetratricopeptide repeat protein [Bacteroidota bacterium]